MEEPLVSEKYQFGGTIDCYGDLDGNPTLIDFKTSKAIYPEMIHQVAAYRKLLVENSHEVKRVRILRIGRSNDEGFEDKLCGKMEDHWKLFSHCLQIYNLRKKIKE